MDFPQGPRLAAVVERWPLSGGSTVYEKCAYL